jgi:hypothetical protein
MKLKILLPQYVSFAGSWLIAIHLATLIVMLVSSVGVIQSLMNKNQIQCVLV